MKKREYLLWFRQRVLHTLCVVSLTCIALPAQAQWNIVSIAIAPESKQGAMIKSTKAQVSAQYDGLGVTKEQRARLESTDSAYLKQATKYASDFKKSNPTPTPEMRRARTNRLREIGQSYYRAWSALLTPEQRKLASSPAGAGRGTAR